MSVGLSLSLLSQLLYRSYHSTSQVLCLSVSLCLYCHSFCIEVITPHLRYCVCRSLSVSTVTALYRSYHSTSQVSVGLSLSLLSQLLYRSYHSTSQVLCLSVSLCLYCHSYCIEVITPHLRYCVCRSLSVSTVTATV